MGVDAPLRHLCAKMVVLKRPSESRRPWQKLAQSVWISQSRFSVCAWGRWQHPTTVSDAGTQKLLASKGASTDGKRTEAAKVCNRGGNDGL